MEWRERRLQPRIDLNVGTGELPSYFTQIKRELFDLRRQLFPADAKKWIALILGGSSSLLAIVCDRNVLLEREATATPMKVMATALTQQAEPSRTPIVEQNAYATAVIGRVDIRLKQIMTPTLNPSRAAEIVISNLRCSSPHSGRNYPHIEAWIGVSNVKLTDNGVGLEIIRSGGNVGTTDERAVIAYQGGSRNSASQIIDLGGFFDGSAGPVQFASNKTYDVDAYVPDTPNNPEAGGRTIIATGAFSLNCPGTPDKLPELIPPFVTAPVPSR